MGFFFKYHKFTSVNVANECDDSQFVEFTISFIHTSVPN